MHNTYQEPTDLSPLLEVCYKLAEHAHAGIARTKKDGDIPYITHPIIVYKLLQLVGVDDQLALAASFLHDVMEDCEEYKKPGALQAALVQQCAAAQIPDGEKFAHIIAELCEELTNANIMQEGKRGWQWEHGQKLSPRAKLVKIADQAASLVDDILLPSDRSYEQMRKFNMKALECAKACAGDNERLDKLFKVIFTDAMAVMDGEKQDASSVQAERAKEIRQTFSLETSLSAAEQYPTEKRDEPPTRWRQHPAMTNAQTGLVRIGVTNDDTACSFSMLVDPHLGAESPCNKAVLALIQNLEAQSPCRVTYRPLEMIDGRAARTFKVKPPIALAEFIERASKTFAIEPEFAEIAAIKTPSRKVG